MLSKMLTGSIILLFSCTGGHSYQAEEIAGQLNIAVMPRPANIWAIPLPAGYQRIAALPGSFTEWLRKLELKNDSTVYLYNGSVKANQSAQFAVLDISVGNKDLQQCADAVMRLRAEYLFSTGAYNEVRFIDNEGGIYQFDAPYTKERLLKYLEKVFGMCGSASLSKQLKSILMKDMQPGDVLIKGGFPGHAVIVADMAENDKGEKIYLLAQSYMPAQDIHILKNPANENFSPWYQLNNDTDIITPEYFFTNNQLKSW